MESQGGKSKRRQRDGRKNLPIWTEKTVLPTSWQFDPDIKPKNLSVAGYIFCPPKDDACSGVNITKTGIEGTSTTGMRMHPYTANTLHAQYTIQVNKKRVHYNSSQDWLPFVILRYTLLLECPCYAPFSNNCQDSQHFELTFSSE